MVKISGGSSASDRISFRTDEMYVAAIRREDGEIELDFSDNREIMLKSVCAWLVISIMLFVIKSCVLVPQIRAGSISEAWYLLPAIAFSLLSVMAILQIRAKGIQMLRNHGAEHMVLKAYNHLKRLPSIEEARKFSRIHTTCGITFPAALITCQVIGFVVFLLTGVALSDFLLIALPLLFHGVLPLNLLGQPLQLLTTSRPEDSNLELAIAAVKALDEAESRSIDALIERFLHRHM